jgi:hypothetical protein
MRVKGIYCRRLFTQTFLLTVAEDSHRAVTMSTELDRGE